MRRARITDSQAGWPRGRFVFALVAALALITLSGTSAAYAGDSTGYHWGSDSNGPSPGSGFSTCPSSGVTWLEPSVTNSGCGHYGVYIGEVGGYWDLGSLNCVKSSAWNSTAADRAKGNVENQVGIGANGYWFAAGPGLDPNYDGTEAEASSWGALQAQKAWALWQTHPDLSPPGGYVLFMDVEEVGGAGDGWSEKVNSTCSSSSGSIGPSLDQHTIDGFIAWIWNNTPIFHGVYSSSGEWNGIFNGSNDGNFSGLTEAWTADWGGDCVQPGPLNWTQGSGSCSSNTAGWFGGFSGSGNCALAWQWSGTGLPGEQTGPAGDYTQIDDSRINLCD